MATAARRARAPRRWPRRLLLGLLLAPLLLLVLATGATWWTLPPREATLRLPTLSAPVEVGFDERGIPRLRAATERDAAVALGVLHARDRLFQMEMMRRTASGRLSEVAGGATLRLDRLVRTLGLARRAEADLAALPPEARDLLEAYAEGVNAWIGRRGRFTAPEFLLLGPPAPWRPSDSLLWGKLMGLWLSGNWRLELERARLAETLTPERLAQLWPSDDSPGRPDLASLPAPDALARLLGALPRFPEEVPHPASASNAWAVGPGRSTTGGTLLAADPHLGFSAPILWYLARIELPDGRFRAGATSPGVPLVVIGRNESLAWGFTTTHSDTQDVFVERDLDGERYETPEGPRAYALREEILRARGRAEEVLRVRETRHGPVISDLDPEEAGGRVLSVAMANLAPRDTSAAGLLALNRATNLAEARAAAALVTSPPQNLVVAEAAGGVAMYLTGRTPRRAGGNGALPAPGWDGRSDWLGFVPFDEMPHVERPASGLVVNANNRVQPPGAGPFLGRDWFGDWRFRRIGELLRARDLHAPEEFAAMQNDAVSLLARETLPLLLARPRPSGAAGAARDLLLGWDGTAHPALPQPLIFNAWWRDLVRSALDRGGVPGGAWPASPEFLRLLLSAEGEAWCGEGGCGPLAAEALERAVSDLSARFGPDPAAWRWGDAHRVRVEHPLLRFLPVVGPVLRLESETPGDGETVSRGGLGRDLSHVHGAGLRMVADLASPDGLLVSIASGQSGHPLSRHWGDLHADWASGRALRLGREATARARLRLEP